MTKKTEMIIRISSILLFLVFRVGAQTGSGSAPAEYPYATFNSSIAVIITVLIAALFLIGFFTLYIRSRSDATSSTTLRRLGTSLRRRNAARGLDRTILETFPKFGYSEVKDKKIGKGVLECAVCLNEFQEEDTCRLIPRCDHVFHPECIDAWLVSHVTCPVCRADLTEEVSIKIEEEPTLPVSITEAPEPAEQIPKDNQMSRLNPMTRSVRGKIWPNFSKSHSTGHSLVQPGGQNDRFTLRLPEDMRKKVMTRALDRTASCVVALPTESSSRRGYRNWFGEGSARGGQSLKRVDPVAKSDRWMFSMAPSLFSRGPSMRLPKGKVVDEVADSTRPPV